MWGVEIDTDKVLDTVLKVGVKLLEKEAQKLEGDAQMDPESRKIASGVVNLSAQILEKERQEHRRGMDEALKAQGVQPAMQPVPQNGANAVPPLQPLPDPLGATVQAVEEIGAHILTRLLVAVRLLPPVWGSCARKCCAGNRSCERICSLSSKSLLRD